MRFCKKKWNKKNKKKGKLENRKPPVQIRFDGFTIQPIFDRFSDKINHSIEPDQYHGQFAVQSVEPAGPIRV